MQGWVRLNRQLLTHDLWLAEPFTRGQAWVDLFALANHEQGTIYVRGNRVVIERGQVGWSELSLAQRWQWSRGKVRRFLNELETAQQIVQQKTFITTVITICNYERWQSDGTADSTANGQQTVQQTDTNKNDNNDKNEKKKTFSSEALRLSDLLLSLIRARKPDLKPKGLWARDIDLMIRIDHRDPARIEQVIRWAQADPFWQNNILSGAKLRTQFDQLELKMNHQSPMNGQSPEQVLQRLTDKGLL